MEDNLKRVNVADGTVKIENNVCVARNPENGNGIIVYSSKGVTIRNNVCSNHGYNAIVLFFCSNSIIEKNQCFDNGNIGIVLVYCNYSFIFHNNCNNNYQIGMHVWGSDDTIIFNNSISRNGEVGLIIEQSEYCGIMNNTMEENNIHGTRMIRAISCLLNYNFFKNNYYRGLFLDEESAKNWIYFNDFLNNSHSGQSQGRDEGIENLWYDGFEKKGNYWDDLNGWITYEIDGKAKNLDLFPMKKPFNSDIEDREETTMISIEFPSVIFVIYFFYYFKKRVRNFQSFKTKV